MGPICGKIRPLLSPAQSFCSEALKPENLSDGKLLCALVMAIQPTMMPQACAELGVHKVDIFTPPDLMPAPPSNPDAVLHCLYSLARTVQSKHTWTGPKLRAVGSVSMPFRKKEK